MIKPLTIAQLGNPILRQIAQPIDLITDDRIQQLIDALIVTAEAAQGVGIAAPQVSHSQRVFIVASSPNARYPDAPQMSPVAMINPRIISGSEKMVEGWEGCLSIPGLRGWVPRHETIELEYHTRDGVLHSQTWSGFVARIIQHELDHLNGILFIDRVLSTADLYSEAEYQKQLGFY